VAEKVMLQHLPALAFNRQTFGFAFSPIASAYVSLGLYFIKTPSHPPDAIVFADSGMIAQLDVAHSEDKTDLDSRRGAMHQSTDIAVLPISDVYNALADLVDKSLLTVFLSTGRYNASIGQFSVTRQQFLECMARQSQFGPQLFLAPSPYTGAPK
jgi:hypothetical protein